MSAEAEWLDDQEEDVDPDWESDEEDEPAHGWVAAGRLDAGLHRSLALGVLAMAPLFVAYELGLANAPDLHRSQSELSLFRLLTILGDHEVPMRRVILALAVIAAAASCFRRRIALGPSLFRVFIEGVLGAIALGPALALGMRLFGGIDGDLASPGGTPDLAVAARVLGAAAFEELLFRVLLYGALFLVARRIALFFGVAERIAPWASEVTALLGSSAAFAAIHLSACTAWLGPQGEAFSGPVFLWRFLAGALLALLFRWRGPGVAAWTHGLFNLGLLIGTRPEILL